MGEFLQKFIRAVRVSRYEKRPLIEDIKEVINKIIRRKLMKVEKPPRSIKQWYKHATNLDRH